MRKQVAAVVCVFFSLLCVYVCMYICVYVCMYICVYVCMYICVYVHMYICVYVCMYICVYVRSFGSKFDFTSPISEERRF